MPLLIVGACLLGLAIGSFLNVVIHRAPKAESLIRPPSHCPNCGHAIRNRHNIPVLGWVWLRGRCADCGVRISARYPLVELATAVLFIAIGIVFAHRNLSAAIPAYWYLAAIGLALTMIDLDVKRLPDNIVLPSYLVLGAMLTFAAVAEHDMSKLLRGAGGAVALYALYFALAFAYPGGMGFGDVKLAGLLGAPLAFLSWPTFAVGAFGAFLIGGLAGLAVIITRHGSGKTALPFGPFMIASAFVAIFSADPIWAYYTRITLGT